MVSYFVLALILCSTIQSSSASFGLIADAVNGVVNNVADTGAKVINAKVDFLSTLARGNHR